MLKPRSSNPPAKIKDPAVIKMVMDGMAVYNAKSGELLLLPEAELAREAFVSRLRAALYGEAGLQPVACGHDEAIFSIAERFVRDWDAGARAFSDMRPREMRLLGWSENYESASEMAEKIGDTVLAESAPTLFWADNIEQGFERSRRLLAPAEPGSLHSINGYRCGQCGKTCLPDSPLTSSPRQPGADEPAAELEDIATPGANTILELCGQLNIDIKYTLKAMLYIARRGDGSPLPVAAFVRGDYNVSMTKLSRWLTAQGIFDLRTADKSELVELVGEVAGYCGPVGLPGNVSVVCDRSVVGAKNTVVGANKPGYHIKGCCQDRDFDHPVADIAQFTEGTPCPSCGAPLATAALRECGFLSVSFNDEADKGRRALSYRNRDGSRSFPFEWAGNLNFEALMLAGI